MLLKLLQAKVEEEDEEAIFLFLDMEKAFDRCSWPYLKSSLSRLGFGDTFIGYVSLFYNDTKPPKRRISINGHVGQSFELHSGVAQGCPLSPLLFLCITEAFTRLVQHDPNILGINTNGTSHKISQFADDTTLIAKPPDLPHMQTHLNTWCEATGMKENMNKREGLLLGRMRRFVLNAPKNIVPNWTPDGTPIRALGVPMGNRLDEEDWWHKRYRLVKARIAAWKSLAHLSITGRKHATSSSKQSPIPAIRLAPILALLPHHARKHPRRTRRRLLQHPLGTTARNLLERRRRVRQIKSIHTVSPKLHRSRGGRGSISNRAMSIDRRLSPCRGK